MSTLCGVTGRDLATVVVDPGEKALVGTFANMLADPEWLLPIVAAQPQYRRTYYGLTAAALLEDLWYDGLANWVERNEPKLPLAKTRRGEPGASGDYLVGGRPYSHKSGDGPSETGVHWDALVAQKSSGEWTSSAPVVYVASGYGYLEAELVKTGATATGKVNCRSAWPLPPGPPRGKVLSLIRWAPDGSSEVLALFDTSPEFSEVWHPFALATSTGTPANHLELVWLRAADTPVVGQTGTLLWRGRPGVFVLPADLLKKIPTGSNNRATTLSKATVLGLMDSATALGLWTPMPMWHAVFAAPRPPDLYLAQRGEFDRRFSPASRP